MYTRYAEKQGFSYQVYNSIDGTAGGFSQIEFIEYEVADYRKYYYKRAERDKNARVDYSNKKKNLEQLMDDIFVLDIIREDMKYDDPRLQSIISE